MKPRLIISLLVVPVLLVAALHWLRPGRSGVVEEARPSATGAEAEQEPPPGPARLQPRQQATRPAPRPSAGPLLIRDVAVRGLDGRIAWRGDVDLAPVLARIEAGQHDAHRNDGGIFGNREGSLPARSRGYYHEYVVRTPGLAGPGPQRLVLGAGAEVYYSPDHYATFRRVR